MEAINEMRAECLLYYVGRRHSPDHADLIVPKDETEVRRIHEYIQEEQKKANCFREVSRPLEGLNIIEIVEIDPTEEATDD